MKLESQLQVFTASGVAPFTVNRTTLVTNLNAQYLNGQLGTYYAAASSLSSYLPLAGGTLTGGLTVSTQLSVLGATATDILRLYVTGSTIWKLGVTDASGSALNISADFGSFTINKSTGTVTTPGAFVSTVVTGTAPLTVASTTLVSNLNVQYLNSQLGGYYQNAGNLNAGTLLAARLPAFTGDVTSTVGTVGLTLANVLATPGTYTKVTVNAKGLVTAGASLASADLPTYTGTITSGQVTTGLGFTPAYGNGAYQSKSLDTVSTSGLYQYDGAFGGTKPPDNAANYRTVEIGSGSRFSQIAMPWNSENLYFRYKVDTTFTAWRTVIHDGNYTSYPPARWATGRTISLTGDVTGTSVAFDGTAALSFAATIANSSVTYAKIQNVAAASVIGNSSASVAQAPQALSMATLAGMLSGQTMNIAGSSTSCTGNAATATNGFTVKPGWAGNQNLIEEINNFNLSKPSGFYQGYQATNSPSATWYNLINVRHSNAGNDHGFQLAMSYYDETLWSRSYSGGTGANNGTFTTWRAHLHSGNFNSYALPLAGGTLTGALNGTTAAFSGAITQGGNQVLHAGNYTSYTLPRGGSWYGANLPGTRWGGMTSAGGEIVFGQDLPAAGQMGILIDGCYIAAENNGFWSLASSNDWTTRRGMSFDGTYLRFDYNSATAYFSNALIGGNQVLHAGNYTSYPDTTKLPLAGGTLTGSITATNHIGPGTGLTGTAPGLNIGGNCNNITQYVVNQNVGTGNSPSFTGLSVINTITGAISGNAGTVTNATFYRQFTVRDDRSDSGNYSLAGRPTGLYAIAAAGTNGPGATYLSLIHVANSNDVAFQIAGGYNSDAMYFRGTTALQNGTGYSAWRTVIHSGNIASQTVATAGSCTGSSASCTGNSGGIYSAGGSVIQTTSAGTSYVQHIQVREAAGGGGNNNEIYAPAIGFHWSGLVASNILMEASGRISIRNNPGTGYENFIAATITASNFSGPGTGLTGTASGLNIGGNANNITQYTINQSVGTGNSPSFTGLSVINTITGAVSGSSASCTGNAASASSLAADTSTRFKLITFTGEGGDSGNGALPTSYGIYQQGGGWTHPYPDLCIGFHTGIKIGAYFGYGGTRFFNNSDWATEIFSVGNGDSNVRVVNTLYVGGNIALHAGNFSSYALPYTGGTLSGGITATNFSGPGTGLTGYASGLSVGGSSTSCTGNAATATGQQSGAHFTLNTGGVGYGLVGTYDADKHQGLFAMGPSYTLAAGGTLANFYGVSWSYDYSGRQLNTGYNLQHCLAIANAGTVYTVIGQGIWTSGLIRANGAISSGGTITAAAFSGPLTGNVNGYNTSGGVGANTIVVRDSAGYIYGNYINTNVSETENPSINSFFTSNGDGWLRKSTVAHVKYTLSLSGTNTGDQTNISGSSGSCTGNAAWVTDGVYLSTNQSISGVKTFSSAPVATNIAKAWVRYDMNSNTINASFNVSSVTDNGTGDCTVNFSSAMVDANYVVAGTATYGYDNQVIHAMILAVPRISNAQQAGNCRLVTEYIHAAGVYDSAAVRAVFYR